MISSCSLEPDEGGLAGRRSAPRSVERIRQPLYPVIHTAPSLARQIAKWGERMKISARNKLHGTILDVTKGATTAHVRIDVGGGAVVTASITNEAVDELKLKKGDKAYAVIKATDVMVGLD
jgi:molybdopterin-binding protein